MLTRLWLHRCQQRENYFPAMKETWEGKKKKMTEKGIRSSCEYFFPAIREQKKKSLWFVLLSGCDILHRFPSILSYPILKAIAISHEYFCGRLLAAPKAACQRGQAAAAPSSGLHPCVPTALSGGYRVISRELMPIAWELTLLYRRVNSTLSAFRTLRPKPRCPRVCLHNSTIRPFPFIWTIGGGKNFARSVKANSKITSIRGKITSYQ